MTLNIQSSAGNNACYNRIHKALSADTKPRGIRALLLLTAVLGAETFITATTKSLDHDVFPTECLQEHGGDPAVWHSAGLASCDLMMQEFQNSVNMRLLLDIRNSLWQSLGGDSQDPCLMFERLHWDVLSGQSIQEGLMILSPEGEIVVPQDGIYFIYSQVHFITSHTRPDLQLVQYLLKSTVLHPEPTMLGKAGLSRRLGSEPSMGLLSSHQGALFQLEQGDRLSLFVSNMSAVLLQPEATYFGVFKID
ncbi:death ligand 3 isoform X1 [Silurus meridionalis]|nr:death ligand 3 isoform X1 [Silurus meridionalis]